MIIPSQAKRQAGGTPDNILEKALAEIPLPASGSRTLDARSANYPSR